MNVAERYIAAQSCAPFYLKSAHLLDAESYGPALELSESHLAASAIHKVDCGYSAARAYWANCAMPEGDKTWQELALRYSASQTEWSNAQRERIYYQILRGVEPDTDEVAAHVQNLPDDTRAQGQTAYLAGYLAAKHLDYELAAQIGTRTYFDAQVRAAMMPAYWSERALALLMVSYAGLGQENAARIAATRVAADSSPRRSALARRMLQPESDIQALAGELIPLPASQYSAIAAVAS